MQGRGRPTASGPLDGLGRRSIYTEVRRNFLSPMMLAFDTPIPFSTYGRRNTSNVPAQALILMNDPFVIEQAKRWAERLLAIPADSFRTRLEQAFRGALARFPTDAEVQAAESFFATQAAARNIAARDTFQDRALWTDFCHVLMNAKEFVFLN